MEARGTWRILMNDKIIFDRYYCINNENTAKMEKITAHYSSALPLTCTVYLVARTFYNCSIRAVFRFSWLVMCFEGLARALHGGQKQV